MTLNELVDWPIGLDPMGWVDPWIMGLGYINLLEACNVDEREENLLMKWRVPAVNGDDLKDSFVIEKKSLNPKCFSPHKSNLLPKSLSSLLIDSCFFLSFLLRNGLTWPSPV